MDIISFNEAATANSRIEKFIENPDSNSGVLTQPKVIEAGETVTIKSGRQAILADTVINGDLVIEAGGEVFVPAGAGFSDLEEQISTLDLTKQDNLIVNDPAVKTALNATGTAPIYACRAWVNFNGTGTVAIRASGNVSSITDNGIGDYTVNFTTAMSDANYSISQTGQGGNGIITATDLRVRGTIAIVPLTTSSVRLHNQEVSAQNLVDSTQCFVQIFR